MKKAFIYSLAISLIMLSSVGAETPKKEEAKSTSTEESSKLATKQIDQEITELKEAIEGMRTAIGKGDRATFKLYRSQAKSALAQLEKLAGEEVATDSKTAGKMQPSPSATAILEATATPTPEATATPSATPESTPTPSATPTPK
jgi:hypothetical protein